MKNISLVPAALLAMLLTATSAQASVLGWGAFGGVQVKDVGCDTSNCLPFPWNLPGTDQILAGGANQTSALATTYPADPFGDLSSISQVGTAQAILGGSGVIATPELRTYAKSDSNNVGIFSHAVGSQGYTYSGIDQSITLNLNLTAQITQPANTEASARAEIAVIFADEVPFGVNTATYLGEIVPGTVGSENVIRDTVFSSVGSATGFITFDVTDGDQFLIWAALDSKAVGIGAISDALNTLKMEFRDGDDNPITDTTVLMAEAMADIGEVPLPAGVWLFLTGIGAVVGLTRRRKPLAAG